MGTRRGASNECIHSICSYGILGNISQNYHQILPLSWTSPLLYMTVLINWSIKSLKVQKSQVILCTCIWVSYQHLTTEKFDSVFPLRQFVGLLLRCMNCGLYFISANEKFLCTKKHFTLCVNINWASAWQNLQKGMCAQRRQISLGIRPVWSVFAVRMKKAWVHNYPLTAEPRLIWVFAGSTSFIVGFVCPWLIIIIALLLSAINIHTLTHTP